MANSFEKSLCKSWEDELSTGFNLGSKSQLEMAEGSGGVLEGHWPEQGLFPWGEVNCKEVRLQAEVQLRGIFVCLSN